MRPVLIVSLAVSLSLFVCLTSAQEIDISSWVYCVIQPGNKMWVQVRFYDNNDNAIRFDALDENDNPVTDCVRAGQGMGASPWVVTTNVDLGDDTESNPCGMQMVTVTTNKVYTWTFRAYSSQPGQPFSGRSFLLTSTCDPATAVQNGRVNTTTIFGNIPFTTYARDPKTATGPKAYAKGSRVALEASLYPDGTDTPNALKDAKGYYAKDCYSATDQNMQEDRDRFIDENGCPVPGSDLDATEFTLVGDSGDVPITLESSVTANLVNGEKKVYVQCEIAKCTTANNPCCSNPCAANNNGFCDGGDVQDTGVTYQTDYTVQDVPAQELFASLEINILNPITQVSVGTTVRLVAIGHPYGIDASTVLNSAAGFFVYDCWYSKNRGFGNRVNFVNAVGCPVTNSVINLASGFELSDQHSDLESNLYRLISGQAVIASRPTTGRLYIRCSTGICTSSEHNYCKFGRCGATNNLPGNFALQGFQGLEYSFAVVDPLTPAVQLPLKDDNGNDVPPNYKLRTGKGLNFGAIIVPGGTGPGANELNRAAGAYVHSCVSTITNDGVSEVFNVTDANGCRVSGTPVSFSEPCTDNSEEPGSPPFSVSCGKISTNRPGVVETECSVGICETPNNNFCMDRCAAGPLTAESNALNLPQIPAVSSQFRSEEDPFTYTAKRSEEIRRAIIGACVAIPLAFCGVLGAISWLCLKYQKKRKFC